MYTYTDGEKEETYTGWLIVLIEIIVTHPRRNSDRRRRRSAAHLGRNSDRRRRRSGRISGLGGKGGGKWDVLERRENGGK